MNTDFGERFLLRMNGSDHQRALCAISILLRGKFRCPQGDNQPVQTQAEHNLFPGCTL